MNFFKKTKIGFKVAGAFLKKHRQIIVIGFLVGIVGFFGFSQLAPFLPQPKPHEKIAVIGRYPPNELPAEILTQLSIGLTTLAKDGSAAPGLAEKWTISENGLIYRFTLAENLRWQDDTPVKTEQIEYQFNEVEQETVDDRTIKFKLKDRFSPLPTILSQPVFKKGYIGIGPYEIKRIKKSGNVVESVFMVSPEKKLTFRFYPTEELAVEAFKLGQVDILSGLLSNQLGSAWEKNIEVSKELAKDRYLGLFFNTENQLLSEKSLRQALAYAIQDKPEGEKRATGPISPLSWAYNPEVKDYQYDPEKARELFEKTVGQEAETVEISLSTTQAFLAEAEKVKQSWQTELPVKVNIVLANSLPEDYQAFLGLQQIPADPDQYVLWHSTRSENITRLKNVKIDKLLEDGRKIYDRDQRKEKYWEFQKTLLEECPVVFLSHPEIWRIERKELFTWF